MATNLLTILLLVIIGLQGCLCERNYPLYNNYIPEQGVPIQTVQYTQQTPNYVQAPAPQIRHQQAMLQQPMLQQQHSMLQQQQQQQQQPIVERVNYVRSFGLPQESHYTGQTPHETHFLRDEQPSSQQQYYARERMEQLPEPIVKYVEPEYERISAAHPHEASTFDDYMTPMARHHISSSYQSEPFVYIRPESIPKTKEVIQPHIQAPAREEEFIYPLEDYHQLQRPSLSLQKTAPKPESPSPIGRSLTIEPESEAFGESTIIKSAGNSYKITPLAHRESSSNKNPLSSFTQELIRIFQNGASPKHNVVIVGPNGKVGNFTSGEEDKSEVHSTTPKPISMTTVTIVPITSTPMPTTSPEPLTATTLMTTLTPTTTPMPTTTLAPEHVEYLKNVEKYYERKQKKITFIVRVEDAPLLDATTSEWLKQSGENMEWTKTILEPVEEYHDNPKIHQTTQEIYVPGPATGSKMMTEIVKKFVDGELVEEEKILPDGKIEKSDIKHTHTASKGDSKSLRSLAFRRLISTVKEKFGNEIDLDKLEMPHDDIETTETHMPKKSPDEVRIIESTKPTTKMEATNALTSKPDDTLGKMSDKFFGLMKRATPDKLEEWTTPSQTTPSKRETKSEVTEMMKKEESMEVMASTKAFTLPGPSEDLTDLLDSGVPKEKVVKLRDTESHIMVITKTPPIRPPNPYHHSQTTEVSDPEMVSETTIMPDSKAERLPQPLALHHSSPSALEKHSSSTTSSTEENMERTFFRGPQ